jgi:hypothetical protein
MRVRVGCFLTQVSGERTQVSEEGTTVLRIREGNMALLSGFNFLTAYTRPFEGFSVLFHRVYS